MSGAMAGDVSGSDVSGSDATASDASGSDASGSQTTGETARVVLLGKPGCHLCDDARAVVERVVGELGERYIERDITTDPALMREHGESIPVLLVDGVVVDFWRVSEERLRAALSRR